jgi:hypothetical protein
MIPITGDLQPPSLPALEMSDELRGYVQIRPEHGQPVNFVALLAGLKPAMDDWVPKTQLRQYEQMCRDRGLYVAANAQFASLTDDEQIGAVVGSRTLTTTRAAAHPLSEDVAAASVHVFVGADRGVVDRTRWSGWYPLVSGGRASSKPWIDHFWFGLGLGYPSCCIEAFAANNNWSVNNMPYQSWRATRQPSLLCNSLMRFSGLTWAAHLPCRYDCPQTVTAGEAARAALTRHCPALADYIDSLLSRPCLVLNEWEAFAFSGVVAGPDTIEYSGVTVAPSNRPGLRLFAALRAGSRVVIRDDLVLVYDREKVIWTEQCRTDCFAPRVPVLLDFGSPGRPSGTPENSLC